jgi:hypothetical protein
VSRINSLAFSVVAAMLRPFFGDQPKKNSRAALSLHINTLVFCAPQFVDDRVFS